MVELGLEFLISYFLCKHAKNYTIQAKCQTQVRVFYLFSSLIVALTNNLDCHLCPLGNLFLRSWEDNTRMDLKEI